jgi:hypothetical protein
MKRSEMQALLQEKLLELYMLDFSTEERARFLLEAIEKVGMLPPFNESTEESKVGYGAAYLSDEEVRLRYIRHFCKWEPED